jgi:16S rRNA (cytosine1402-N4)-methyltransferase
MQEIGPSEKPKRRPRYSGRNPRQFHEKYKELNPDKYPELVSKVISAGKTPAGTHRPICVAEILEILNPLPGQVAVDVTLGYGGHALQILQRILPGGRLIGLDTDPVELPKTAARLLAGGIPAAALEVVHSNYAGLARVLGRLQIEGVDMILADLGCSSMQLDDPGRGFSYKLAGPLDLRMNPNKGLSGAQWLAEITQDKLTKVFQEYGDEPLAEELAAAIIETRTRSPIDTTTSLANLVRETALQANRKLTPDEVLTVIRRVFQAIRIAVNDEFGALETFLRFLPPCLKPGGTVAILTFHSGEDRRVKHAFKEGLEKGLYSEIARDVIRPSALEIRDNPRASSAKLRWARA